MAVAFSGFTLAHSVLAWALVPATLFRSIDYCWNEINQLCNGPNYPAHWKYSLTSTIARRVASWRLATNGTILTCPVMLTLRAQLCIPQLFWATQAGWLVTKWHLTQLSPNWCRTTLLLATRLAISSYTPMCEFRGLLKWKEKLKS